jgi:hypothetical protein
MVVGCTLLVGCTDEESEETTAGGGGTPMGCVAPELALPDGSCIRPGIPADGCAAGFEHDGQYSCAPILPPEACAPGTMAVPGETTCRPVMPCGAGRWGDIPVDANTVYVDAAYSGGSNDGSETRPWTTVSDAVAAAASGALVAIAEGTYVENVVLQDKAARLHGVCPDKVTIAGTAQDMGGCLASAVCIAFDGASGTELHGLSLTGAGRGVLMTGATDVLFDSIRVHDCARRGIAAQGDLGPTAFTLRNSLIEQNHEIGVLVSDTTATMEATIVRGTLPRTSDQTDGMGVWVFAVSSRPSLMLRDSLLQQNHKNALAVSGADATVDASVLRDTLPEASSQTGGRGMNVEGGCTASSGDVVCDPALASRVTLRGSLVDNNHDVGLFISGSEATVETTVVRGTMPQPADQTGGRNLSIQVPCIGTTSGVQCDVTTRARVTLLSSVVEQCAEFGIFVSGSEATVEATVVRATWPSPDLRLGRGINVQQSCVETPTGQSCDVTARSLFTLRGSLLEQNHDIGLFVADSDATVERSVVRTTLAQAADGLFGDGVAVFADGAPSALTIVDTRIEDSARAGVASFGGSISLAGSHIRCAAFALTADRYGQSEASVSDGGDNLCGCPQADTACKAVSANLEAPPPLAQ